MFNLVDFCCIFCVSALLYCIHILLLTSVIVLTNKHVHFEVIYHCSCHSQVSN